MEDLNYLLKREQEEILRAQAATCSISRAIHSDLAIGYARRVREHHHPYRSERAGQPTAFNPFPFGAAR
jgi:hypothetical protein